MTVYFVMQYLAIPIPFKMPISGCQLFFFSHKTA